MSFVPFDATAEEIEEKAVLRTSLSPAARSMIQEWLLRELGDEEEDITIKQFRDLENILELDFGIGSTARGYIGPTGSLSLFEELDQRGLLHVVDNCLYSGAKESHNHKELERILAQGRYQYTVVDHGNTYRLGMRVPEGVRLAVESVMGGDSAASRLLKSAWKEVHDLSPDDSSAYLHAVKAVEATAFPALGITDTKATLSTAVRAIEKREATWRLPFLREHTEYSSKDVLLGMLKSLYRAQRDRHGSVDYSGVTHEEAEAAVLMAVSLVGWFESGLVQQRDTDTFQ